MRNNTRRNRNIGTPKQGYGQDNKMKVPIPVYKNDIRNHLERVNNYKKKKYVINEHEFIFIVEETLLDYEYACSINDIVHLLQYIPKEDYGEMKYIVFRQPTRTEAKLEPVWGRLAYSFEFENNYYPAIIIEAYPLEGKLNWSKKQSVNGKEEFSRLQNDGFEFMESKRCYEAEMSRDNARNTQLYRTLFHEFSHYVHYLDIVERLASEDEEYEEWEKRFDYYHHNIPSSEKEVFAHNYATKLRGKLLTEGIIPFNRKEDEL